MPSINRGTLPQNFLDSVSSGMRLPQPEPQYWFARMALGGRLSFAALNAGQSTVQQFVSMAGGGDSTPLALDAMVRAADAYPGAVVAIDDFGKGMGDTIKLRRPIYSGGGYDLASRQVQADKATSTAGQAITAEEVPIVLQEYEGPFGPTGVVQPYAIRSFDARYRANKDELATLVTGHLSRDYIKWMDTVIRDQFRKSLSIALGGVTLSDSQSSVSGFVAGSGHTANLELLLNARKSLSDREWAPFPNGRYMCLVPTSFNVQMLGDPDWRALSAQHGKDKNLAFGYIGSVQDLDIFECTTLKSYAATETPPGDTNPVPASQTVFEGMIIGPGVVGMGTAQNPEARFADDTDYGKMAKVLWNAVHAFETIDNRGVQRFLFASS